MGNFDEDKYEKLLISPNKNGPTPQFEYYIVENDVSLLLKKRPCLDKHYK